MSGRRRSAAAAQSAALDGALSQIERTFGKEAVMRMGDPRASDPVEVIPTSALTLDLALGIGGLPRGRIVEVFGPESSGKTTLLLHVIANAQAMGLEVAFIDAEHALDPAYAKSIGCDVDKVLLSQPDSGEQALEIADLLARSGGVGVIAIDSVAALTPRAELEGAMGDQTVGLQARMMSQAMRKLKGNAAKSKTLVIFTNQLREKVGVVYGSPETTPGGRALPYYASQRLDVRRISEGSDKETHNRTKVVVKKNKLAAPYKVAWFDIEFGLGISAEGCLLDLGLEHGILGKSGNFIGILADGETLGNGRANAKAYLREKPDVAERVTAAIHEAVGR